MAAPPVTINSLPSEVLIHILSVFPTRSLLRLAGVNRRFSGAVGRLYYSRLVEASFLEDHEMILECYHPSVKLSTPTLFCEYIDTDGLSEAGTHVNFGEMNGLYTRFRPFLGDENRRPRTRYPTRSMAEGAGELPAALPSQDVHLEAGELFSQLCTVASLIKVGPRPGLFQSIAQVTDGWVRVFRHWLQKEAGNPANAKQEARQPLDDESILWADTSKNVGLRFRVIEKDDPRAPVFVGADEEPPISYTLEHQELLVRTNQLLLSLEASLAQQVNPSGKAVVMASMAMG